MDFYVWMVLDARIVVALFTAPYKSSYYYLFLFPSRAKNLEKNAGMSTLRGCVGEGTQNSDRTVALN